MAPAILSAQTITSPYRFIEGRHDIGAVAGVLGDHRGSLGIGPGEGPLVGVRYGLILGGPFTLEGNGFFVASERDVLRPVPGEGLVRQGSADVTVLGLDARIRFTLTGNRTWYGLAPYASIGGGIVGEFPGKDVAAEEDLVPGELFDFGPSFLGVLALGTRWIPGDRLTFHVEADLNVWKLGMPPGFRQVELEEGPLPGDEWTGVRAFLVGVSYRF